MTLLNPTWLFALAAVSIPVLIHLWNIRNGKVLKVGSISLITAAARKSSRSLNLVDLLLLLLRCLLLIAIAILLAMPLWKQNNQTNLPVKGWVLLPRENLQEGYLKFKTTIDSLTGKGYEFHYFNKGFAKANLKQALALKNNNTADTLNGHPLSYNELLWQLQKVAGNIPLAVFTANNLNRFTDERTPVALNLKWRTFTPADSVTTWLQSAWFTAGKDIVVIQGTAKPSGTAYVRFTVKPSANGNTNPFEVKVNGGKATVCLKNDAQHAIVVDTTVYNIAIYTDNYPADARYLQAALEAGLAFVPHRAIVKNYKTPQAIPQGQNWVFWLADKPLPALIKQHTGHILSYVAGQPKIVDSWINTSQGLYNATEPKIPLFKLVNANQTNALAFWQDGFGNAILSTQKQDNAMVYHCYTHFNPVWNNLVWSDEFPEILLKLITADEKPADGLNNHRVVTPQQLPAIVGATGNNNTLPVQLKNFTNYIWALIIALFFMERWLAHRKKQLSVN